MKIMMGKEKSKRLVELIFVLFVFVFDRICERFSTNFESLSNDILYEIFEYLDFYYLYSSFSNLNQRFYNLIYHPEIGIKMNTISIPNEQLSHYFNDILQPNIHRIGYVSIRSPFDIHLSKFNSIEQLVINNRIDLNQFYDILLCIPQLHRLSIDYLSESRSTKDLLLPISMSNNQLTHISLRNCSISFQDFSLLTKKCFSNLQVLRINTNGIRVYFDGDQWKDLILSSMTKLRIFDFQSRYRLGYLVDDTIKSEYQNLIDKFNSSFWIDRQWLFDTEQISVNNCIYHLFYSKTSNKYKSLYLTSFFLQLSIP